MIAADTAGGTARLASLIALADQVSSVSTTSSSSGFRVGIPPSPSISAAQAAASAVDAGATSPSIPISEIPA